MRWLKTGRNLESKEGSQQTLVEEKEVRGAQNRCVYEQI